MYIATYGSLRQGIKGNGLNLRESLLEQYGPQAMRYEASEKLKGFKLFDLGNYPTAVYEPYADDEMVVDIYECDDSVTDRIDGIELGAGYHAKIIRPRCIDGKTAIIYLWTREQAERSSEGQVSSGDWVGYVNSRGRVGVPS